MSGELGQLHTELGERTSRRLPIELTGAAAPKHARLSVGLGDLTGRVATAVEQHILKAAVTQDVLDLHPFRVRPLDGRGERHVCVPLSKHCTTPCHQPLVKVCSV
jgi:hypothetical protein